MSVIFHEEDLPEGVLAIDGKGSGDEGCDARDFCPPPAIEARDDAFTMATVSTVGFAVGFIGVGVGVVLLLTGANNSAGLPARQLAQGKPQEGIRLKPWFGAEAAGVAGTF